MPTPAPSPTNDQQPQAAQPQAPAAPPMTMIDPDGNYVQVPVDQGAAQIKKGYKATSPMVDPDGNSVVVPMDQSNDLIKKGYKVPNPSGATIGPAPSTASRVGHTLVNGDFPYVHPVDAANAAADSAQDLTPEGVKEHPVEAAVGKIAGRILGFTVGNPNHPENAIGSGKEGILTNPVTGTLAASDLGLVDKGAEAAAAAPAKIAEEAKEVARQMLVYGEGKADKVLQLQEEFRTAYPALSKLLPVAGKTAGIGGGGVFGAWELYKLVKGLGK